MTDQTIPDVTDDDRRRAREWAESIESTTNSVESTTNPWSDRVRAAARVIRAAVPTPDLPTLADMNEEERRECQWMQADVKGYEFTAGIIAKINQADAHLIASDGETWFLAFDTVTPRPDLPRMTWPGDQKPAPAPALPEGWRLADHKKHGRVLVVRVSGDTAIYATPFEVLGICTRPALMSDLTFVDTDNQTTEEA